MLEIRALNKTFGAVHVLKDINVEARVGEFLVLVGPSGCGKSTLLSAIAGLHKVDDGEIRIADRAVNDLPPKQRDIAMVFQTYALYPNLTVAENIAFPLEARGINKAARRQAVARVADILHITDLLDRKPRQLSGGQRQRVAMGRALVRDPKIFLFDEPLSNLDAKLRVVMRTEIKKLHRQLGTTIVYVTHDQIEAMTLATRIVVMLGGVVQQVGTPEQVYDTPANLFVAGFIGSPAMNVLDARLVGANRIELRPPGGRSITLELPGNTQSLSRFDGQPLLLGLRPEAVTDTPDHDVEPPFRGEMDWPVELLEPTGSDTLAILATDSDREFVARFRAKTRARAGQNAHLFVDLSRISIFDPATENSVWSASTATA